MLLCRAVGDLRGLWAAAPTLAAYCRCVHGCADRVHGSIFWALRVQAFARDVLL